MGLQTKDKALLRNYNENIAVKNIRGFYRSMESTTELLLLVFQKLNTQKIIKKQVRIIQNWSWSKNQVHVL
jgi:hypothetical protein